MIEQYQVQAFGVSYKEWLLYEDWDISFTPDEQRKKSQKIEISFCKSLETNSTMQEFNQRGFI